MSNYLYDIKIAAITFPFIALLISVPFILINYHKYGSVTFYKSTLLYSFVLYMICAYFLIILPLPEIEEVRKLTTPRMQLIPFSFVLDIIKNFKASLSFLVSPYIYVTIFNIFLTMPFGIYLRYYFKCSKKKTIIYSFILSLFFELTQLSGLYFIYPRGYRLFDVDDLICNTFGGFLGYLVAGPLMKILPTIEESNISARKKGKEVTGFKRFTSLILDLIIVCLIFLIISIFYHNKYMLRIVLILYFIITPILLKGSTPAQRWLNLKVVDYNNKFNIFKTLIRYLIFVSIYFVIPLGLIKFMYKYFNYDNLVIGTIIFTLCGVVLIYYTFIFMKYLFTRKPMLYENISKTKLISTIDEVDDKEKDI